MSSPLPFPFFSEEAIARLLGWEELLPVLREALIDFSAGRVTQPVRTVVSIPEQFGWFAVMPALYKDVLGAKLVTVFPQNAERGIHTHLALIQLFRADTGEPLALMDGRIITAWRTAAVSALATDALSRMDARVLAILGSGVQARTHWKALRMVRPFAETRVWSRTPEHAKRFAEEVGAVAKSAREAVSGADVIVTVTGSAEPILQGEWLKEGAHVNAVGAVGLSRRELDEECLRNSAVIVESLEAAAQESGELLHSGAAVYAELGEILAETKPKPAARTTVFKSLGIAVEDVAAARYVFQKSVLSARDFGL